MSGWSAPSRKESPAFSVFLGQAPPVPPCPYFSVSTKVQPEQNETDRNRAERPQFLARQRTMGEGGKHPPASKGTSCSGSASSAFPAPCLMGTPATGQGRAVGYPAKDRAAGNSSRHPAGLPTAQGTHAVPLLEPLLQGRVGLSVSLHLITSRAPFWAYRWSTLHSDSSSAAPSVKGAKRSLRVSLLCFPFYLCRPPS